MRAQDVNGVDFCWSVLGRLRLFLKLFLQGVRSFHARTLGNMAFKTNKRELWYEIRLWAKAAVSRIERDKAKRKGLFVVDDIHEYLAEETLAHAKIFIGGAEEREEGRRTLKRLLNRIPEDKRVKVAEFIEQMGR